MSTKPDDLAKAVQQELDQFAGLMPDLIKAAADTAAKQAVKQLKSTSPRSKGKNSGKYAKNWKAEDVKIRTGASVVVHNKDYYMLAHLLEYGHPLPQGGRSKAQPHIQAAEEMAMQIFQEELERRIEDGA